VIAFQNSMPAPSRGGAFDAGNATHGSLTQMHIRHEDNEAGMTSPAVCIMNCR